MSLLLKLWRSGQAQQYEDDNICSVPPNQFKAIQLRTKLKSSNLNVASPLRFGFVVLFTGLFAIATAFSTDSKTGNDMPPYRLVASDFPPFTLEKGDSAPGALAEIVQLMAKKVGKEVPIEYFPWARAQYMSTTLPRTVILPLTRIPSRESQYTWLVEIYRQDFVFFGKKASDYDFNSLDVLRTLRVGAYHGSASRQQLQERQFEHIVEAMNYNDLWRMLDMGIVDVVYCGRTIALFRIHQVHYDINQLRFGLVLDSGSVWLAGGKDFTEADVAAWSKAFEELKRDGSYVRILRKYGLPE